MVPMAAEHYQSPTYELGCDDVAVLPGSSSNDVTQRYSNFNDMSNGGGAKPGGGVANAFERKEHKYLSVLPEDGEGYEPLTGKGATKGGVGQQRQLPPVPDEDAYETIKNTNYDRKSDDRTSRRSCCVQLWRQRRSARCRVLAVTLAFVLLLILVLGVVLLARRTPKRGGYQLFCYFTNYAQSRSDEGKFLPENIDASLCSHIVYFNAKIENGRVVNSLDSDKTQGSNKGFYERVNDLKQTNPALRTLLSVGGYGHDRAELLRVVANSLTMQRFAQSVIITLREASFDGLDLSWLYPSRDGDSELYAQWLKNLREEFDAEKLSPGSEKLLLMATVSGDKWTMDRSYHVRFIAQQVDYLNVMAYDLHYAAGRNVTLFHSALYAGASDSGVLASLNQNSSMQYWLKQGAPRNKLVLSLSFLARSFTLANVRNHSLGARVTGAGVAGSYTRTRGIFSYYEVCPRMVHPYASVYDMERQAAYSYFGDLWLCHDNPEIVKAKAEYIRTQKFAGASAWTLDFDDFTGTFCKSEPYPLLRVLASVLLTD